MARTLLPLDGEAEAERAARVAAVGPGGSRLVQYTSDVLFQISGCARPGAPRPQPGTVSALIALGQVAQLPSHLNRAMDNGLTKAEGFGTARSSAFYAGWPNAFSAVPVAKAVFESGNDLMALPP